MLLFVSLQLFVTACRSESDSQTLRPRQLRDVPANKLAFNFQADVSAPANLTTDEAKSAPPIQQDFESKRPNDALLRTVISPDGQRALALYAVADEPTTTFRIDLYSSDGSFIRNVTPPTLAVVFQDSVAWSADSSMIAFVGRKSAEAQPSPTPSNLEPEPLLPSASPVPTATVGPIFAPLQVFNTEQVYVCNKDGYELRPLTTRDGLIYFGLTWAPDNHALAALACKESEWDAREKEFKTPAGRPRVIGIDGKERLLDDNLAEAPPVWSPDSSKIATAFGPDIGIYDAANSKAPTQARLKLSETLLTASATYEAKLPGKKVESNKPDQSTSNSSTAFHASFNPVVRIEWPSPEKMYLETAFIRLFNEPVHTWSRWHLVTLSPQAVVLKK
jgi:Tol biopolymer transport system component